MSNPTQHRRSGSGTAVPADLHSASGTDERDYSCAFDYSAWGSTASLYKHFPAPSSLDDAVEGSASDTPDQRTQETERATSGANIATAKIIARYDEKRSRPWANLYIWDYEVTIALRDHFSGELQLEGRRWLCIDGKQRSQETNVPAIMGGHPRLTWERPVYRYRSAVPLGTPFGNKMRGWFKARIGDVSVEIPTEEIVLPEPSSGSRRTAAPLSWTAISEHDERTLSALLNHYNTSTNLKKGAKLDSADFPTSIRTRLEDWVLGRDFNQEKPSVFLFSVAGENLALKSTLPDIQIYDMFVSYCFSNENNYDIDGLNITFVNAYMGIDDLRKDLDAALQKHGIASKEKRDLLLRDFCKRIDSDLLTTDAELSKPHRPRLPPNISWPIETFSGSPEARRGGGGIVAYLDRVWLAHLEAGAATRRILEERDPSAITAIKNYTRPDPITGARRKLPDRLHFPTLKEINDRIVASAPDAARIGASRATQARKTALG